LFMQNVGWTNSQRRPNRSKGAPTSISEQVETGN